MGFALSQLGGDVNTSQVDAYHRALRTSIRPVDVGAFGSYRLSMKSGVIAAGMVGPLPVWEFRWGLTTPIAVIRKFRLQAVVSTTAFAATATDTSFSLFRAQGFTVLDSTGGTATSFAVAKTGASATRFASSQMSTAANGGMVILNTAATGLTGGTKVLDSTPIHILLGTVPATAAAETVMLPSPPPYLIDPADETPTPIELNINEGLVLQCDAMTGTGTWRICVEIAWDEIDPAKYQAG